MTRGWPWSEATQVLGTYLGVTWWCQVLPTGLTGDGAPYDDVSASSSSPLVGGWRRRLRWRLPVAGRRRGGGWAPRGGWPAGMHAGRGIGEPRARWLRDAKDHYPLRDRKGVLVEISLRLNEL